MFQRWSLHSNTPVREPVQAHRFLAQGKGAEVPDLEIYVVNPYPNIEEVKANHVVTWT